jgi:hypothetical protein
VSEPNRDEPEPLAPALRPQFGLRALGLSLVAVSLTFALSRWLPVAIVLSIVFSGGLVALHLFSTALGSRLRASRPDERAKRQRAAIAPAESSPSLSFREQASPPAEPDRGELRERRSIASLASWMSVLALGACIGVACGWSFVADARMPDASSSSLFVPAIGLAAFGFLGAVAGGLSHALAVSLFVAHRQSVEASEAEGPRG